MIGKLKSVVLAAASVLAFGGSGLSATVSCPGSPETTDREFKLTTTPGASCLAFGSGNINGSGDAINALGYVTIDKSENTTEFVGVDGELTISGSLSGPFSFTPPAGYQNFVLALKSGNNEFPAWAAFLLPAGVISGSWEITVHLNGLSHANLYGQACPQGGCPNPGPSPVPLPAPILMLGLALGGLGFARWLKNRRSQQEAA